MDHRRAQHEQNTGSDQGSVGLRRCASHCRVSQLVVPMIGEYGQQ